MKLHQKLFWVLVLLLPIQLGRHFWPEASFVLGLKIDYLAPTIYLTDLLVVGILGLWGWEKLKIKNLKLKIENKNKNLKIVFFIFSIFIFLLINSLFAQNQGAALYRLVKIIEFTLLGFYVARDKISLSIRPLRGIPSECHFPLSIAVIYSSLIAIAQFLKQASLGGIFWWLGERSFNAATLGIAKAVVNGQLIMRPYASFSHPNVLAGFLLIGLILTFRHVLQRNRLLAIGYLLLVIFALAISFSRSAWLVGLLVSLWFLVWRLWKKKSLFARQSFSRDGLFVICGLSFVVAATATILLIKLPFSTEEALFQRVQLIKAASLMIQTAPLQGVGLNNFIVRLPEFWPITGFTYWLQPVHNIYLLVAAETGIVGLVIFGWFLALTYKRLLITNRRLLITALSAILTLGLFDHYWLTLQQAQLLFTVVLGLAWSKVS